MSKCGDEILFINDTSICINTGLSERESTQAKLMSNLTENGIIAIPTENESFDFKTYNFLETYSKILEGCKTESIFVSGPAFKGIPLLSMLNANNKVATLKAINSINAAVKYSFTKKISIPNNGPLGTIIGEDGSILFLPPSIFTISLQSHSDLINSTYAGCYLNTALSTQEGWYFTISTYIYQLYTTKLAFPETNTQKRVEDYFDKNFIPLSWICNITGYSEDVQNTIFKSINTNLSLLPPEHKNQNKKKSKNKIQPRQIPEIPVFEDVIMNNFSDEDRYKNLKNKVKTKRFIRKHSSQIKFFLLAVVIIVIVSVSFIKTASERPTTKGLEPIQVVEMFYSGLDKLNSQVFDATRDKNVAKNYSTLITGIFVTSKMRQSYVASEATYTAGQWLNLSDPETKNVFGVTHLKINVISENVFLADYYIIRTEGPSSFAVTHTIDTLTLSNRNKMWIVTDIQSDITELNINSDEFVNDLKAIKPARVHENQAIEIINALNNKYTWLPTVNEAEIGKQELIQETAEIAAMIPRNPEEE